MQQMSWITITRFSWWWKLFFIRSHVNFMLNDTWKTLHERGLLYTVLMRDNGFKFYEITLKGKTSNLINFYTLLSEKIVYPCIMYISLVQNSSVLTFS